MNIRHSPKYLFSVSLILFTAAWVTCCDRRAEKPANPPLRFAFQNRIGSAIPIVAVEKGFFAKQGIAVEPLRFNSGPACAEALYSGSADIGTMGDSTAIIAVVQYPRLRIVASHSTGEHRHRLIVKKDGPVRSIQQLRNRRIGIKKGTSTHGGFLSVLLSREIPPTAVTIVDLNPSTMPDALIAGSVDAIAASEPTPSLAELKGGRELLTFGGLGNQYPILMLARDSFISRREGDLRAFFAALRSAEAFVRDHPDETTALLSRCTGLPLEVAKIAMGRHEYRLRLDESIVSSLRQTARFLLDQKKIASMPDLSRTLAARFLEE